nr:hypothetical protein B0A51_04119 [Rachicladosporium sp. CCFEE 5018]
MALLDKPALQEIGLTHVLSVLRLPLDQDLFAGYTHKVVEVDDVDDENLLEHLPGCVAFIQDGLDSGGAVLVHCAMGKSRSATAICAYLMHTRHISASEALAHLRQTRPFCEPNDGFMKQLELYHQMGAPDTVEDHPIYQRWLYKREVEFSGACGQAPDADKIRFEDEHAGRVSKESPAEFELKCKKCRRQLATSPYLLPHTLPTNPNAPSTANTPISSLSPAPTAACTHYFLDPLSWMRAELEQGKLEGRLECPKCKANVGKYAWQGMRCSCRAWVVPGISLAKGRVDEMKLSGGSRGEGMGIRRPPGAVNAGGGQAKENL